MGKQRLDRKRPDIACALEHGWIYDGKFGSGHLRFVHPNSPHKLTLASSPSEWRNAKNSVAWIRRNTPR